MTFSTQRMKKLRIGNLQEKSFKVLKLIFYQILGTPQLKQIAQLLYVLDCQIAKTARVSAKQAQSVKELGGMII